MRPVTDLRLCYFMGECYVHGMRDGEKLKDESFHEREFIFVLRCVRICNNPVTSRLKAKRPHLIIREDMIKNFLRQAVNE